MKLKDVAKLIKKDRANQQKVKGKEGVRYYKGEHDILDHRLFYVDSDGRLREDKYASNIKIPHQFHTELVDQKVQYLLSNPIEIETKDEVLATRLEEYVDEDFQEVLQDVLEGASNKGTEYVYGYMGQDDKVTFQVADSLSVIEVRDEKGNLDYIIRYYDVKLDDNKTITKVEVWDSKQVTYCILDKNKLILDNEMKVNPQPHILKEDDKSFYDGGGFERVPFFKLQNNKYEKTDLEPIKELIDDYDLMAASLSNNLEDFQDAIYVVKGFHGDNLDEFARNIKTRKRVGVSDDGEFDIKTIDIPYEARKAKLDLDKEAIYKFGMGFDNSQIGDGNITNVVIQSRYSLLDLKCNKAETRLRKLIRELLEFIVQDINRRYDANHDAQDLDIKITRSTMVNENDVYNNEKTEAETKEKNIKNILSLSNRLSEETILQQVCDILDIDYQEEMERLEIEEKQDTSIDIDRLSDELLVSEDV